MAIESHLAELEKRHQALEQEINEALTHPSIRRSRNCRTQAAQIACQRRDRTAYSKTRSFISRLSSVIILFERARLDAAAPAHASCGAAYGIFA